MIQGRAPGFVAEASRSPSSLPSFRKLLAIHGLAVPHVCAMLFLSWGWGWGLPGLPALRAPGGEGKEEGTMGGDFLRLFSEEDYGDRFFFSFSGPAHVAWLPGVGWGFNLDFHWTLTPSEGRN